MDSAAVHDEFDMILIMFCVFPLYFIFLLSQVWFFFRTRSWHGTVLSTVTKVERDFHTKRYRKIYYEYPVVTYSIGDTTYTDDYAIREVPVGFYQVGQKIPIRYDENNPKDFVFQDEFRRINYILSMILYIGIFIFLLFLLAGEIV